MLTIISATWGYHGFQIDAKELLEGKITENVLIVGKTMEQNYWKSSYNFKRHCQYKMMDMRSFDGVLK